MLLLPSQIFSSHRHRHLFLLLNRHRLRALKNCNITEIELCRFSTTAASSKIGDQQLVSDSLTINAKGRKLSLSGPHLFKIYLNQWLQMLMRTAHSTTNHFDLIPSNRRHLEKCILLAKRVAEPKSSRPVRSFKSNEVGKRKIEDEADEKSRGRKDSSERKQSKKGKSNKEDKKEMREMSEFEKKWKTLMSRQDKEFEEQFGQEAANKMREERERRGTKNVYFRLTLWLAASIGFAIFVWSGLFWHARHPDTGMIIQAEAVNLDWQQFLHNVIPSGHVAKIVAYRKQKHGKGPAEITVAVHTGAMGVDERRLAPAYIVKVPDMHKLEWQIRNAEMAAGLPPEMWANIHWVGPNQSVMYLALLAPLFIFIGFYLYMFRKIVIKSDVFSGGLSSIFRDRIRILDPTSKEGKKSLKIKFRDVAGLHEAKVEISEFVDYLRRPAKFTKLGARLPKGALLTGPPGCGKTLLAKALAAESSVPFISVNGTEFVEMIGGLGASRVRELFKKAKSRSPCIIYIDEIDTIGRKRQENDHSPGGGHSELEQTLNQLLVEMDGMDTATGIVVIASTNRPDILDKALLRPGRFDRHISIDLPTVAERKEMFDLYLQKIKKENLLTGISQRLAQLTPGFSGADIANVVNEAAIHAATNMKKMVKMEDIEYALQKIIAGPEKRSRVLVKEEREVVAFHESGHALVGWLLEHTEALLKVTIIPRTSAALGFAQYSPKDRKLFTKEELFDRMCMMLGGRAAENVTFGRITTGAQNDLDKVTKQAQAIVKWYGMNEEIGPISFAPAPGEDARSAQFMEKPYSKKLGNIIDQEVSRLVSDAYFFTEKLLKENKEKLDKLAKALLQHETLNYEDVKKLIGPPKYGDKNVVDMPEEVLPDPPRAPADESPHF